MNLMNPLRAVALLAVALVLHTTVPTLSAQSLKWNVTSQTRLATPGETNVHFAFSLTNITPSEVVITGIRPSCGCTTAKLPPLPWHLAPGKDGQIEATVDIRGKRGMISKVVFVDSTAGTNMLTLIINIPEDRARNMELALADRQAVFKWECVSCHVIPTVGKTGVALYQAACGVCHESDHRATMVPSLLALAKPTGREYWDQWIRKGKEGSLMPAFDKDHGGPLSEEQIQSLVSHLATTLTNTAAQIVSPTAGTR